MMETGRIGTGGAQDATIPVGSEMMPNSNILVVELVAKYQLVSDGTTSWIYIDVDLSDAETYGPYLKSITGHTDTRNRSVNHEWKVVAYASYDGRIWEGPNDIFAAINANGYVTHTPFTNVDKLGIKTKYALAVRNSAGTNSERATVSASLAFEFST